MLFFTKDSVFLASSVARDVIKCHCFNDTHFPFQMLEVPFLLNSMAVISLATTYLLQEWPSSMTCTPSAILEFL